jgi:hypothetical protein
VFEEIIDFLLRGDIDRKVFFTGLSIWSVLSKNHRPRRTASTFGAKAAAWAMSLSVVMNA